LITQYPFSYCISISGNYLRKLVKRRKEIEYANHKKRGILIPIADLIACDVYKGADLTRDDELSAETGFLWNNEEMRLFLAGDCGIVKRTPAEASFEGQKRYVIDRMMREVEDIYLNIVPVRHYITNGREIVKAETINIQVETIEAEPQKGLFKRKEAKKGWDKYSDTYLIPKMFIRAAAEFEKYKI